MKQSEQKLRELPLGPTRSTPDSCLGGWRYKSPSFTTVTEALKPFDDGFLEDPLFTWCVKYKCHYEPSTLILLNNWDKDRGTNRTTCANVGYCNGYFEHTLPITRDTFNRTLDLFFNNPWSRARINSQFCLVGNMVPGLWRSEQTEGYLGEQVYKASTVSGSL